MYSLFTHAYYRTFPILSWVTNFFALRGGSGIVYTFILRLRGCPGLAKMKFCGWVNSDEQKAPPQPQPQPQPQHLQHLPQHLPQHLQQPQHLQHDTHAPQHLEHDTPKQHLEHDTHAPQHLEHLPQHLQHDTHAHAHTRMCSHTQTHTRTAWGKCPPGFVREWLNIYFEAPGLPGFMFKIYEIWALG